MHQHLECHPVVTSAKTNPKAAENAAFNLCTRRGLRALSGTHAAIGARLDREIIHAERSLNVNAARTIGASMTSHELKWFELPLSGTHKALSKYQ
jgi:hypothetical protein